MPKDATRELIEKTNRQTNKQTKNKNKNKTKQNKTKQTNKKYFVDQYNKTLANIFDDHAPAKTRTIIIRLNLPWYNDLIREEKNKRRQLEKKWRRSKLEIDRQSYQEQRQFVISLTNNTKINYYSELIKYSANDQKQIFKPYPNISIPRKIPYVQIYLLMELLPTGSLNIFIKKIQTIRDSFPVNYTSVSTDEPKSNFLDNFAPTTNDEIKDIIMNSSSKSCSLDPVPKWLVKEGTDTFVAILTHLVNTSLQSGSVPASLKEVHVTC